MIYCTCADMQPLRWVQSEVNSLCSRRPEHRNLAEINNDIKVTCLYPACCVLSPWQHNVHRHDNQSTANHSVARSHADAAAGSASA